MRTAVAREVEGRMLESRGKMRSPLFRISEAARPTLLLHHHVDHVACVEVSSGDRHLGRCLCGVWWTGRKAH